MFVLVWEKKSVMYLFISVSIYWVSLTLRGVRMIGVVFTLYSISFNLFFFLLSPSSKRNLKLVQYCIYNLTQNLQTKAFNLTGRPVLKPIYCNIIIYFFTCNVLIFTFFVVVLLYTPLKHRQWLGPKSIQHSMYHLPATLSLSLPKHSPRSLDYRPQLH